MAVVRASKHNNRKSIARRHCRFRKVIAPKKSAQFRYRRSRQANFVINEDGYVFRLYLV